jgi:hypothetical protein
MSTREKVLLRGLVDWVALDRIHWDVSQDNVGASISVIQEKTLELLRSLAADELFRLGDLSGPEGTFTPWAVPLDEAISRIRDVYVSNFSDTNTWPWYCWIDLTDEGEAEAEAIAASAQATEG